MNKPDPSRERAKAVRRSRIARLGVVLSALAGSLGIAGALGLSAAVSQATTPPSGTSNIPQGNQGAGTSPTRVRSVPGDDGEHQQESDDDGHGWVPARPSPQFNTGGSTGTSGTSGGGKSHATSGGS